VRVAQHGSDLIVAPTHGEVQRSEAVLRTQRARAATGAIDAARVRLAGRCTAAVPRRAA